MALQIQSTNEIDSQKINCVIYGLSGAGKTSLAKTLAGYKPLIISAEGGLLSIRGSGIDFLDLTRDGTALVPRDKRADRIREVYQYLLTPEAREKYDTIVIDSLTEIGQCVQESVKKEFPNANQALPMWGEYGNRMRDLVKAFRDLPGFNVVFISLSKISKDENGRRFSEFDIAGSISDKLPGFLDLVLYLRVNTDGLRELVCQPTDSILAKDRSGKLDKVEPANLGFLFNKINERK